MAELGLLDIVRQEGNGGSGGDTQDCGIIARTLGYGLAPEPWLECGLWPILLLDSHPAADNVARGTALCAVAFSESGRAADWRPTATTANREQDHYVLNGGKALVLGGAAADIYLVTADHQGEMACFLVPRDSEGVTVSSYRIVDGGFASTVRLFDVRVPIENRVGSADRVLSSGVAVMMMAAAEMVGLTQRLFDETLAYMKTREQFGQPIGRFQAIQHRMVDNYVALEKASSTLVWLLAEGWEAAAGEVAGAKALIAEAARTVAHEAIQLHGGMGVTDELLVGHGLKRIILLARLLCDPTHGIDLYREATCHDRP